MKNLDGMKYNAFISYRHSELDSLVARTIHKKLEAFKVPKSAQEKTKDGRTGISRVFRDEDELPLSDNLSDPINNALANSEFLICICSPRYLESKWCMREIEVFLQTHNRDHILVVLAEGEPADVFPERLTYEEITVRDDDGTEHVEKKEIEPLAADTRGNNKREIMKSLDTAVMKLSAAILGLNYDDLKQRHREAKMKRRMAISGMISAVVLIFAVFATVTLIQISQQNEEISHQNSEINRQNREINDQNRTITDQYNELQDKYAEQVARAAEDLLSKGRRRDAVDELRRVLPDTAEETHNIHAEQMLHRALNTYGVDNYLAPAGNYDTEAEIATYDITFDERFIFINDYVSIRVFEVKSGKTILNIKRSSEKSEDLFNAAFCGSQGILVMDGEKKTYYSLSQDNLNSKTETEDPGVESSEEEGPEATVAGIEKKLNEIGEYASYFCSDGGEITLASDEGRIFGIDHEADIRYCIDTGKIFKKPGLEAETVSFDSGKALISLKDYRSGYLILADEKTGEVLYSLTEKKCVNIQGDIIGNRIYYTVLKQNKNDSWYSEIHAVDMRTGKQLWQQKVSEYLDGKITRIENQLFVCSEIAVVVLDEKTGKSRDPLYCDDNIMETWVEDNSFCILCKNGTHKTYDDGYIIDWTDRYFMTGSLGVLGSAKRVGSSIYYCPERGDYIVRQTPERTADAVSLGTDYEGKYSDVFRDVDEEDDADLLDTLPKSDDVNMSLLDNAFFSEDKKLIFAVFRDHTGMILDASTLQSLQTIELEESMFSGLRYSETCGGYVLDSGSYSYLMNKDYQVYNKTDRIVDEGDGKLVLQNENDECFRVPFIRYEELIRRADDVLSEVRNENDT